MLLSIEVKSYVVWANLNFRLPAIKSVVLVNLNLFLCLLLKCLLEGRLVLNQLQNTLVDIY